MSRALWDTCCSAYFAMSNRVKQGWGVCYQQYCLPPTLINYPIAAYPITSYPITSYPITSNPKTSYHIISYPITSYPIT